MTSTQIYHISSEQVKEYPCAESNVELSQLTNHPIRINGCFDAQLSFINFEQVFPVTENTVFVFEGIEYGNRFSSNGYIDVQFIIYKSNKMINPSKQLLTRKWC